MSDEPAGPRPTRLARVGVVTNPTRDARPVVETLLGWTSRFGVDLVELEPGGQGEDLGTAGLDLLVAVGGDGTVLGALRSVVDTQVPVLGVAYGHLGYLAHITPEELLQVLDELAAGRHGVAALPALEVALPLGPATSDAAPIALNDVVLSREHGAGQAFLAIDILRSRFTRLSTDALVLATPLGSTAYNLSAGGPMVSPDIELVLITPVAPAGFFNRTTAVAAADPITVTVLDRSAPVIVEADGQVVATLRPGQALTVTARSARSHIVRLDGTNFYTRLAQRLEVPVAPVLGPNDDAASAPTAAARAGSDSAADRPR